MEKEAKIENRGTICLGEKAMVSDPCYGLNTWCQGVVENVLPGEYDCSIEFVDKGDWGIRVSAIEVTHVDHNRSELLEQRENFEVGVDSGQAGIFDYEYYAKYHTDASESEHVDEEWYWRCCDKTLQSVDNPNYKPFDVDYDDENWVEKWIEYQGSIQSVKRIERSTGDTIDNLGFVSSSGYGDGGYNCYTCKNAEDKIVSIRVEFINDRDDEED